MRTLTKVIFLLAVLFFSCDQSHAASYVTMSKWFSFTYPDGWAHETSEATKTRYVENVMLQPRGQDFSARPGQIVLRVFDPFYVIEEAKIYDYTDTQRMFTAFVRSLPGETGSKFSTESVEGVSVYVARSNGQGVPTSYFGRLDHGYLAVVGWASGAVKNPSADRAAIAVLKSVDIAMSARASKDGPAQAVAAWYTALGHGDSATLSSLTCQKAKDLQYLVGGFTGGQSLSVSELLIQAGRRFDFAGLRYVTYAVKGNLAVVRIAGLERGPNNTIVSFPTYARTFGSNMISVENEGGQWKVCAPVPGR